MLAGVLGAYAASFPRATVLSLSLIPMFSTLIEVPAMLLIAAWFVIGLIPGLEQVVTPSLLGDRGSPTSATPPRSCSASARPAAARSRPAAEPGGRPVPA